MILKRLLTIVLVLVASSYCTQSVIPQVVFSTSASPVTSVQMTGAASWHYGSDEQTGTVTLSAASNGQGRMELQLTRGSWIETQGALNDENRTCTWQGFDGVVHETAWHNCMLETIWFLPQVTMQPGNTIVDDAVSLGSHSDPATTRIHHERHPALLTDQSEANTIARLSAFDLDVDTSTDLPVALSFNTHPDNHDATDILTEIRFSDYRTVDGVQLPFRIQKLVNHALVLDFRITSAYIQPAVAPAQ